MPPGPLATRLAAALAAGMSVGAVVGLVDAALGARFALQFVQGARVAQYLLFTTCAYAFMASVVAVLVLPVAHTLLGPSWLATWASRLRREHRVAREQRAARAMAPLAVLMVGIALLLLAPRVWEATYAALANRKRPDLVVLIAMLAGVGMAVGSVVIFAIIGPRLAALLHHVFRRWPRTHDSLARARVLLLIGFAALAAMLLLIWHVGAATVQELPFRAMATLLALALLTVTAYGLAVGNRATALARCSGYALVGGWVMLAAATFALGQRAGVIAAVTAHTGLGGPINRIMARATDFDGDGFASRFGGLDCDDNDAHISPAAYDTPGDGIDQNCIGGDASVAAPNRTDTAPSPGDVSLPTNLNIILITIDALPASRVGAYGYHRNTTPNLDKLAAAGIRFDSAWSHAPSTRFAIPTILAGRLPHQLSNHPSPRAEDALMPKDAVTVAGLAKAADYVTGAIMSFVYFDRARGLAPGFDTYDNENRRLHNPAGGTSSAEQSDKAIAFITRHKAEKFFLWVHYFDPHAPYQAHPQAPSWPGISGKFDQEVFFTDLHIGRLIASLTAQGLADRTAIVVTSDHGEAFGERGIFRHGYHLYATHTRVPLIVYVPGMPGGVASAGPRVESAPAAHIDIAPTVAHLLGTSDRQLTGPLVGRSLLMPRDPSAMVPQELTAGDYLIRALASARCHVIYNISPHNFWEVYDLAVDPQQTRNLSDDASKCAAERAALGTFVDAAQRRPLAPKP